MKKFLVIVLLGGLTVMVFAHNRFLADFGFTEYRSKEDKRITDLLALGCGTIAEAEHSKHDQKMAALLTPSCSEMPKIDLSLLSIENAVIKVSNRSFNIEADIVYRGHDRVYFAYGNQQASKNNVLYYGFVDMEKQIEL